MRSDGRSKFHFCTNPFCFVCWFCFRLLVLFALVAIWSVQRSGYNTWPRLTMVATSENQHTDHLTVQTATNENQLNTYVYHAPHHHKKTTEGGIILPKGSGYYRIGGNFEAEIQATTELAGISKRKQYYEYIHIYIYIYMWGIYDIFFFTST